MIKSIVSKVWFWVGALVAVLLAMVGYERSKRKRAELKLVQKELDAHDAVVEHKREQNQAEMALERQHQDGLRKQLEDSKTPSKLSPAEIEAFWAKKK